MKEFKGARASLTFKEQEFSESFSHVKGAYLEGVNNSRKVLSHVYQGIDLFYLSQLPDILDNDGHLALDNEPL